MKGAKTHISNPLKEITVSKLAGNQANGEILHVGRVVLDRREGNRVFIRTLRPDEKDTGEGVTIQKGEQVIFEAGALTVDLRQIDNQSPKGFGGYAPVSNTVWTWSHFVREQLGFFLFFFALARRLDAAHRYWASAMRDLQKSRDENGGGIPQRLDFFDALATAEVAIVALHRAIQMVYLLVKTYCPELTVPESVKRIRKAVEQMRNSFEHIDERAEGKVDRSGNRHMDALKIFHQPDFKMSSIIRYQEHSLNLEEDVKAALLDCRKLVLDAIEARASQNKTEM